MRLLELPQSQASQGWCLLETMLALSLLLGITAVLSADLTNRIRLQREIEARVSQIIVARSLVTHPSPTGKLFLQRGPNIVSIENSCAENSTFPVSYSRCNLRAETISQSQGKHTPPPLEIVYDTVMANQ